MKCLRRPPQPRRANARIAMPRTTPPPRSECVYPYVQVEPPAEVISYWTDLD